MIALDVGNTFAKWRVISEKKLALDGKAATSDMFEPLLDEVKKHSIRKLYISWVGSGQFKDEFVERMSRIGCNCIMIKTAETCIGLVNGYKDYSRLGVDRWLAMLASWKKYERAVCVVDAGTALTVDFVNDEGKHLGGYILPGVRTAVSALNSTAALIDAKCHGEISSDLMPGKNTNEAVYRGALVALLGGIGVALSEANSNAGKKVDFKCIMTGGDSRVLLPFLPRDWTHEEGLVLDGITIYANSIH